jgi:hypothetical protein
MNTNMIYFLFLSIAIILTGCKSDLRIIENGSSRYKIVIPD